jgi:hypothetical protein
MQKKKNRSKLDLMYSLNIIKTDDSLAISIKAIDIIQNTEDYKTGQI